MESFLWLMVILCIPFFIVVGYFTWTDYFRKREIIKDVRDRLRKDKEEPNEEKK